MASIFKVFSGEIFKSRKTAVSWLIVLFPILVTILFVIVNIHIAGKTTITDRPETSQWFQYSENYLRFFVLFFPMLAALAAFSLANIEDKNNGWKLMYTQPVKKHYFYFSKILLLYLFLLISVGLGYILMLGSGWALSEVYPQLNFSEMRYASEFLGVIFFKHFVVVVAIATIHFILSLCWNNFILCVGSACFMTIFGMIVSKWKYAYLLPYSNSPSIFKDLLQNDITWVPQYIWIDALWTLGLIIIGYFVVKYKQTK